MTDPAGATSRPRTASLGCVLRLHGSEATYAYHDHGLAAVPGRVASTDDAVRRAVERAVGADEGTLW